MSVVDLPLPRLGETMEEGRIVAWLKQPGDAFKRGEILLEVETDKTVVEVPALQDGVMVEHLAFETDMIPIDAPIARIEVARIEVAGARAAPATEAALRPRVGTTPQRSRAVAATAGDGLRASPRARRLARDHHIPLSGIPATGRGGRISGEDVLAALAIQAAPRPARTEPAVPAKESVIQVATRFGTLSVKEWPVAGQRKGDAFLIHGLFAEADSFTLLARRLAKGGLRVLAIDLPGHGASDATVKDLDQATEAVAMALRATASGPVRLVGHSLGAMIAARIAAEREVEIDRLMLLAPAGLGPEIDAGFITGMVEADSLADLQRETAKLGGGSLSNTYLAELLERIRARREVLRTVTASVTADGTQRHLIVSTLEQVKNPITAIFGIADRIIPWQHAASLPQQAAVHFVKAAGHMPHWTTPNFVAELLLTER
jgi:pyruvate dehydrogenase E2 component (dihydrolipoamide acetyltransferase)